MEEFLNKFIEQIFERLQKRFDAWFFPRIENFFRSEIRLSFSEEEAAAQLGVEKSTLAEIRKRREINFYMFGKSPRYGLHHLQDFLAKHEVKNVPSNFVIKTGVSIWGTESEKRLKAA
jgi:excisionase family DNA binding protein